MISRFSYPLSAVLLLTALWAASSPSSAPSNQEQVLAKLESGTTITVGDVYKIWSQLPEANKRTFAEDWKRLLALMVDQASVLDAAKQSGLESDPAHKKKEADTIDMAGDRLLMEQLSKDIAKKDPEFSKKEKEHFDRNIQQHPHYNNKAYKLQHILFPDKASAEEAYKKIASGAEKFESYLKDTKDQTTPEGVFEVRQKELPPTLATEIEKTPQGSVVNKPVELGKNGYSIIRVLEKKPLPLPTIDTPAGKDLAWETLRPEYIIKALEECRKDAKIQSFGPDGQPIPSNA